MTEQPTPGTRVTDVPAAALEELLRSVPRLVERTLHQAELARSLATHLPCVGGLLGARRTPEAPGTVAPEQLGVLDLFDDEADAPGAAGPSATTTAPEAGDIPETITPVTTAPETTDPETIPLDTAAVAEADLAVPDYDSLAASQVVPRLAMLSPEDLRDVLVYEQSHRHRQTILNRVAQLLEA